MKQTIALHNKKFLSDTKEISNVNRHAIDLSNPTPSHLKQLMNLLFLTSAPIIPIPGCHVKYQQKIHILYSKDINNAVYNILDILMKQKLYFLNVVKKMYLMIVSDDQQDYQESEICS